MFLEKKRSLMIVLVASIAAALLLCASALILLPKRQTAHADGLGTPVPVAGGELEAGSYYLGSDFTIGSSLIIPTGKEVTLNLNGNVLKLNESVSDSVIHVQGTLTLIDGNSQASNTITSALDGGGDVTVNGGVITGGKGSGDSKVGGGVFVDEGGVFNMTGGMIAGNTGDYGGGVRVDVGATFTMTDGEIAYNKAERDGGGLCVCNAARVDLNGGSISNNAAAAGGGIYFEGEGKDAGGNIVYKINGADVNISSNTVKFATGVDYTGNGGGIYIDGSAVEMTDGAISYNRVENNGGGVYVSGGTFNMTGGTIERNTASDNGGGVYVNSDGAFNVSGNAFIYGNTKDNAANNVSLYGGGNIAVAGALSDGAKIGVVGTGELITGYKFNSDKPSKYFFADGGNYCTRVSNEADGAVTIGGEHSFADGECSTCGYRAAASVDNAYYVTLEEAWAAAKSQNEATVVMFKDAEVGGDLWVSRGNNITLDLNGYMLKFTGDDSYIYVQCEFTLTDTYEGNDRTHDILNLATSEPDDTMEIVGGVITGGQKNPAVQVLGGGTFNMTGGTIAGSANGLGGGVYVAGTGAVFNMTGGTITGNNANKGGGVCVSSYGTFNMSGDAVISGNSAAQHGNTGGEKNGGGVFVNMGGTFNMSGGTISGNTASDFGGGVYVFHDGTFTMTGGTISGNSLDAEDGIGGGVYVDDVVAFNVSGRVIISDNKKGKTDNNVQLMGNSVINVTGKLEDAQGNRAHIAVTAEQGVVVAKGFCQYNGNENYPGAIMNPALYFSSDVVASCFRINYSIAAGTDTVSLDMHEYNNNVADAAKWTVNDDGTQATLRLMCAHCLGYFSFTATSADGDIVKQVTLSPTCTAEGSAKYTVTIDNIVGWEKFGSGGEALESVRGTIVATLGKLPHTLSQVAGVNATCTADGTLAHEHCSACGGDFIGGEEKTAAQLKIAALGHDYASEFTTDTAATCTQAGSKSKHCSRCDGTTKSTVIPALGHDYGEWQTATEPTCTTDGERTRVCSRDGAHKESETIAALGHDYGEWTVYRQATVDEFGEERRVCSHDDSHYESRQIPKRIAQLVNADEGGAVENVVVTAPGGFSPDILLVVTEISEDGYSGYQAIADGVGGTVDFVYDVTLKSDGVEVQPDGTITIRLRIPENLVDKSFKLFHLHGSVATDTEYTVDGGYAVITTDRLSEFVFVGTNDGAASPAQKSNAVWIVFIVLFSIIILCEVAYVALRKTGKIKFGGDK